MLSQATVLKAESLKANIEDLIINKILSPKNCSQFYLDSLKFEAEDVQKACLRILELNFTEIFQNKTGLDFLLDLPAEGFTKLCNSDTLYITDESLVVGLIRSYLDNREELPPLDEDIPEKNWDYLTKEERKAREDK